MPFLYKTLMKFERERVLAKMSVNFALISAADIDLQISMFCDATFDADCFILFVLCD